MFVPQSALPGLQCKVEGHLAPRNTCEHCWPHVIHSTRKGRPRLSQEVREDRKKVGRLLKSIRREKFKTQIECAHALGLTSSAMIGAIENGSWYNQKVIFKLINYLKA